MPLHQFFALLPSTDCSVEASDIGQHLAVLHSLQEVYCSFALITFVLFVASIILPRSVLRILQELHGWYAACAKLRLVPELDNRIRVIIVTSTNHTKLEGDSSP